MPVAVPGDERLVARACSPTDAGGASGLDLKPFPFVTADKALSLRVVQDLFGPGIPTQVASQAGGDARQVAGGERPMVTAGVRDGRSSIGDGLEEVGDVIGQGAAVDFFQGAWWEWIGFQLLNRFAGQASTIDEDTALSSFEQDAVVAVVAEE